MQVGLDAYDMGAHVEAAACTLEGHASAAVRAEKGGSAALADCTLAGNGVGLQLAGHDTEASMERTEVSKNTTGVLARMGAVLVARENVVKGNGCGVLLFLGAKLAVEPGGGPGGSNEFEANEPDGNLVEGRMNEEGQFERVLLL